LFKVTTLKKIIKNKIKNIDNQGEINIKFLGITNVVVLNFIIQSLIKIINTKLTLRRENKI
jgi:hypothetical protein